MDQSTTCFIKKDHPLGAKLGVPQKISYLLIPLLIIFMFFTGLCLWVSHHGLGHLLGLHHAGRWSHVGAHHPYFMMYVFIVFMFIHIYLANVEGLCPHGSYVHP